MNNKRPTFDYYNYPFLSSDNKNLMSKKGRIKILKRTLRALKRQEKVDMYRIEQFRNMLEELEET